MTQQMQRTLDDRTARPHYEVLVEIGFENGCLQIAYLEHMGRSEWRTRRTAEKHAREYTQKHGRAAYVSEC